MVTCETCRYRFEQSGTSECRRHAPVCRGNATGGSGPGADATWPRLSAKDMAGGCGEGEAAS